MNKMKSLNLFSALSMLVLVAACGKSMSLQVGDLGAIVPQNAPSTTIDASKTAVVNASDTTLPATSDKKLDANESLEAFSAYDMKELKATLASSSLLKRATLQIPPKEAIEHVLNLELVFNKANIADASKVSICIVETECRSLAALIKDAGADSIHLNLLEVFAIDQKTDAEKITWIYSNSTEFANPGYRKFRFTFEGITSVESGSLISQLSVNSDKMPSDFATVPTAYVHGDEDLRESTTADLSK